MPGYPPIYVGLYVDDFLYFSASEFVEKQFERRIKEDQNMIIDFEGEPKKCLGMKWHQIAYNGSFTVHMSQEVAISALVEELGLENANCVHTPNRFGCPADNIRSTDHLSTYIL